MKRLICEKYFTLEQLGEMKASTISKLREKEDVVAISIGILLVASFIEAILVIAMAFWFVKITMFLVTVGGLFLGLFFLMYATAIKGWQQEIEKAGGTIPEKGVVFKKE